MQREQRQALDLVLTLCEGDDRFVESTKVYGNWFEHLIDQLADIDEGKDK